MSTVSVVGGVNVSFPDHPVIRNMELTGCPDGIEPKLPRCPICGAEVDTVYKNKELEIVGCDECLQSNDAWECEECSW